MRNRKDIPVEERSYAAVFFILSGLLTLVTIWGFWSETVTRRPWKQVQQEFYQYEYEKTKVQLAKLEKELAEPIETPNLDAKQLSRLEDAVGDAQISLDEAKQKRKFVQSESDQINYQYQHALHEGKQKSTEKWKKKLDTFEKRIEGELTEAVLTEEKKLADAYKALADFYQSGNDPEKALSTLLLAKKFYGVTNPALSQEVNDKITEVTDEFQTLKEQKAKYEEKQTLEKNLHALNLNRSFLGSVAESPFTHTREIVQYYLEDFDYTADRCATCHFATDKSGYEHVAQETFEIEEPEEGSKPTYQLAHARVKVGAEEVLIDGIEAVKGVDYELTAAGLMTFNEPDMVVGAEAEIKYETAYAPVLQTHPHRDVLLAKHPVERFGCTPCHGGQGQALTEKAAHALHFHEEYWLYPVFGLDEHTHKASEELAGYMQANCRRCHDQVMKLDYPPPSDAPSAAGNTPQNYAPDLAKGMGLFEDLGCHGCHAVEGYSILETLDKVGPSLAKVGSKVNGQEWLVRWIKNPTDYLPGTTMPTFFPTQEMTKMVYLTLGRKREGRVSSEGGRIIVRQDDGTPYPYAESEVVRIVDVVKSIAAYLDGLKDPEIDNADASYSQSSEAIAAGEQVVKSVGCLACHKVGGLGSDFAPPLDPVGSKVTPNYLRQWVADPKSYDPGTVMPDLRLSDIQVDNVVAFLMSLKDNKTSPPVTTATFGNITEEIDPKVGEELVRTYGCFGCHDIPGFEKESKVGADLGEFGGKMVEELDFGDTTNLEHTWHGWTIGKVTNPRRYKTRRIVSRMPVFTAIGKEEALDLAVLLKSFQPVKYPLNYMHQLDERAQQIDAGRRLVKKYNCAGCHEIEREGGAFVNVVAANEGLDELQAKQFAPPTLQAEGAKVYPEWLFAFLKNPTDIRYGLKVRMPTFGMPDEDATALVKYFSALSEEPFPYETLAVKTPARADLQTGKQIFTALQCISCHPEQGETIPAGSDKAGRPDLSLAKRRLKADWIVEWLKDPQVFQPGTAMPQNWPKIGGEHQPVGEFAGGDAEKQIEFVRDYMISLGE